MPEKIPASHLDLLEKPILAALATLMPGGQPQVQCVWCAYAGEDIRIFTIRGTQKEKNLRLRKLATILLMDPHNPFRYLEIRGSVTEMTVEGAETLADQLTQKYMDQPAYFGYVAPLNQKGSVELIACRIKPTRVIAIG